MKACRRRGGKVPRVLFPVNGGEVQAYFISGVKTFERNEYVSMVALALALPDVKCCTVV